MCLVYAKQCFDSFKLKLFKLRHYLCREIIFQVVFFTLTWQTILNEHFHIFCKVNICCSNIKNDQGSHWFYLEMQYFIQGCQLKISPITHTKIQNIQYLQSLLCITHNSLLLITVIIINTVCCRQHMTKIFSPLTCRIKNSWLQQFKNNSAAKSDQATLILIYT